MIRITSGLFRGRLLKTPRTSKKETTRPTSEKLRSALFNILGESVENSRFLDLCAGSGAIGLEALSRGAKEVIFIEKEKSALHTLRENISLLQLEKRCRVIGKELFLGLEELKQEEAAFEILYFDPPYALSSKKTTAHPLFAIESLEWLDKSPLIQEGSRLFLEEGGLYNWPPLSRLHLQKKRAYGTTILYEFICS